jgi:hypothetical protein
MKRLLILATVLIVASAVSVHAQGYSKGQGKATGSPFIKASSKQTETVKIVAIDKSKRLVTLTGADGDTIVVKCGNEVRNFNQLAVGDDVVTTYTESYTIHVEPSGEAEETKEVATSRANVGAKPGASVYETRTVKAKIDAIDKEKGTVTLATLSGEKFTVTPNNRANLDKVQVGNVVVVTEQIGHAVSVNKPKGKK